MSLRRTLIAGAIFIVILGIYLADKTIKLKREIAISEEERIVPLVKDAVLRFSLTNPNGTFRLQKPETNGTSQVLSTCWPIKTPLM